MIAPETAVDQALAVIEAAPQSAAALTLYALISTLEYAHAGRLFKLTKLKDLNAGQRAIAYGLMERAASDGIGDAHWAQAKARMDRALRGN